MFFIRYAFGDRNFREQATVQNSSLQKSRQTQARLIHQHWLLTCLWRTPSEDLREAHTQGSCAHARSFCGLWFSPAACWSSSRSLSQLKPAGRKSNGWSPELWATGQHAEPHLSACVSVSSRDLSLLFWWLFWFLCYWMDACTNTLVKLIITIIISSSRAAYMAKCASERLLFNFRN